MIYPWCFHIGTAALEKAESFLQYHCTTKVELRKTLRAVPRPAVWSLSFAFCIPLPWIFRVKLSCLHVFACRVNRQHKPEHPGFERADLSPQSGAWSSSSAPAADAEGRLYAGDVGYRHRAGAIPLFLALPHPIPPMAGTVLVHHGLNMVPFEKAFHQPASGN